MAVLEVSEAVDKWVVSLGPNSRICQQMEPHLSSIELDQSNFHTSRSSTKMLRKTSRNMSRICST